MHPDQILMLLAATCVGAAVPFVAWLKVYRRNLELEARQLADQADTRVDDLQRAVDALTEQCAQLAESQDFIGRVLSERLPPVSHRAVKPAEASTPH